jgi:hypothetical protein
VVHAVVIDWGLEEVGICLEPFWNVECWRKHLVAIRRV